MITKKPLETYLKPDLSIEEVCMNASLLQASVTDRADDDYDPDNDLGDLN